MAVAAKPIQSNGRQQQWLKMFANHSENPILLPGFSPSTQPAPQRMQVTMRLACGVPKPTRRLTGWHLPCAQSDGSESKLVVGIIPIALVLLAYPIGLRVYLIG